MLTGKLIITGLLICLCSCIVSGQQFKYTAPLDTVDTTGFYSIIISPGLSAYIKTDFADIRIADKNKNWVPHILQHGNYSIAEELFTPFPILENKLTDSGKNLLVIGNTKAEGIYNLQLFLKNAAVSRSGILSGSNNLKDWFIIDDKVGINRSYETIKDEYLQEINFPLSKYRYLKIIIDNMHNDPLLITKAGFYSQPSSKKPAAYQENPLPLLAQKDSGHISYIEIRQRDNYQFDRIALDIGGSKFYSRDLQICLPAYGNNSVLKPGIVLGNFKLLSSRPAVFELPTTKSGIVFILIKNEDNPPLKIEKIYMQQDIMSLVTYLEKGKRYQLVLGDSLAPFANYDLQNFKDSITGMRKLNYGKIDPVKKDAAGKTSAGNNRWIWISIVFAGIILSFLTYRLIADINTKKNN